MGTLSKHALLFLLVSSVLIGNLGCPSETGTDTNVSAPKAVVHQDEPFRIAIATWIGYGPLYIADKLKLFTREGVNVKLLTIEEIGPREAAFASGDVHMINSTVDAFASSVAEGLKGKVILKADDSSGADGVIVTSDVDSLVQLKGKTVAFPRGNPSHFFLLFLLKQQGLTSKDIKPWYMEAGQAGAAFAAGRVDAAVTWEPWVTKGAKERPGKVLLTSKEAKGLIADILVVRSDVLENRRADVEGVLRAWFGALAFIGGDPDKAYAILADRMGVTAAEAREMAGGVQWPSLETNARFFQSEGDNPSEFTRMFNAAGQIWKEEGLTSTLPIDGSQVEEPSIVNAIILEQKR